MSIARVADPVTLNKLLENRYTVLFFGKDADSAPKIKDADLKEETRKMNSFATIADEKMYAYLVSHQLVKGTSGMVVCKDGRPMAEMAANLVQPANIEYCIQDVHDWNMLPPLPGRNPYPTEKVEVKSGRGGFDPKKAILPPTGKDGVIQPYGPRAAWNAEPEPYPFDPVHPEPDVLSPLPVVEKPAAPANNNTCCQCECTIL